MAQPGVFLINQITAAMFTRLWTPPKFYTIALRSEHYYPWCRVQSGSQQRHKRTVATLRSLRTVSSAVTSSQSSYSAQSGTSARRDRRLGHSVYSLCSQTASSHASFPIMHVQAGDTSVGMHRDTRKGKGKQAGRRFDVRKVSPVPDMDVVMQV